MAFVKDDDDKPDEKPDEKPEMSPWAQPDLEEDKPKRVVGWRMGQAFTEEEVREIMRKEKGARQEYRGLKKAVTKSRQKEQKDPMVGLPPTWQAFWSTVPHLDPQDAHKQFLKEEQKRARTAEKEAAAKSDLEGLAVEPEAAGPLGETTEEEIRRLERRVADMREVLQDKERVSLEWDKKLARCKRLREEADERARRVKRKVEDASYHHGVTVGKMRSSDGYFRYLYEDTQSDQQKKVISLKRSCALMEKQMDLLKGHVRLLLKVAAEDGSLAEGRSAPSELPDGELPKLPPPTPHRMPPRSPELHH
ncbi:unnamed protein product [Polarella glacialis]|uniref:Uncharacterized protein n=2 Tax=Polarella glacialis TaxID=89957 RepID=A0A813EMH1_POLGL|nr:unnamed protein product [Polarella glacialis]